MTEPSANEADAYEQRLPAVLDADEGTDGPATDEFPQVAPEATSVPLDVDEADLAEQEAPVPLDEDDYR